MVLGPFDVLQALLSLPSFEPARSSDSAAGMVATLRRGHQSRRPASWMPPTDDAAGTRNGVTRWNDNLSCGVLQGGPTAAALGVAWRFAMIATSPHTLKRRGMECLSKARARRFVCGGVFPAERRNMKTPRGQDENLSGTYLLLKIRSCAPQQLRPTRTVLLLPLFTLRAERQHGVRTGHLRGDYTRHRSSRGVPPG